MRAPGPPTPRRRFPRLWALAHRPLARLRTEYRALEQLGLRTLLETPPWSEVLPLQVPDRRVLPDTCAASLEALAAALDERALPYATGAHTLYLPPTSWVASPLAALARGFPADAGLKLLRNTGGVDQSGYAHGSGHSLIQRRATHSHRHLVLVANLFCVEDVGPRLYDLLEIECAGVLRAAYVVQHVAGRAPELADWRAGLERLRALELRGRIRVTSLRGYASRDFEQPDCNGNLRIDADGRFRYVDFQNFRLVDYGARAAELCGAVGAAAGPLPALAGPRTALPELAREVAGCVVIELGAAGFALADYLAGGARWCHAFGAGPELERALLALGCTRFSLDPAPAPEKLESALPAFLAGELADCVVSLCGAADLERGLAAARELACDRILCNAAEAARAEAHGWQVERRIAARTGSLAVLRT